jgi:hypothetical protein
MLVHPPSASASRIFTRTTPPQRCARRERRDVATTLQNTDGVLDTLTALVGVLLHAGGAFLYLVRRLALLPHTQLYAVLLRLSSSEPFASAAKRLQCSLALYAGASDSEAPEAARAQGIFGVNVSHLIISLSSMTLAFAFIFGNNLRTIYESVVFLFVVRPPLPSGRL